MGIDYVKRPKPSGEGAAPGVNLSKVTLTKSAPQVSLTKQGSVGGAMRVNLRWNAGSRLSKIDLDLGCLYEYSDGSKSVIQALGNLFRDSHGFGDQPIVWLDGDDRSGAGGENLHIDLSNPAAIRRILVFAYIYEGTPRWADANAIVTLTPANGPEIEIPLDTHDDRSRMCAIALLENQGGEIVVRREVRYIDGSQSALDQAYGWGLQWVAGKK